MWANSVGDAHYRRSAITLGFSLELTWEVREVGKGTNQFLDLDIMAMPEAERLDFKLFRKPMKHILRVSWDSSHPDAVKRAGFCSELAQRATRVSSYEYYAVAMADFREILLAQAFLPEVLHSGARAKMNRRWASQLLPTEENAAPTVLKSSYDPA